MLGSSEDGPVWVAIKVSSMAEGTDGRRGENERQRECVLTRFAGHSIRRDQKAGHVRPRGRIPRYVMFPVLCLSFSILSFILCPSCPCLCPCPCHCPCPFTLAHAPPPVFAGKDASRGLAKTSTKPEDALPGWKDLSAKEKETLAGWVSFFRQRYNQVGVIEGAENMDDGEEAAEEEDGEKMKESEEGEGRDLGE